MKRLFSLSISIGLFVSICWCGQPTASTVARSRIAAPAVIRFTPRLMASSSKNPRYTVKARYPQALGAKNEGIAKLNQAIKDLITNEVNTFKKGLESYEGPRDTSGSSFESAYRVLHSGNNIVSIELNIDTYYEGAAHGGNNTVVLNYDLESDKSLKLADLFKANSNFLQLISTYSMKALKKTLGPDAAMDMLEEGARPTDENYKNWNLTRQGLKVSFDPYQVAPYAAGPQEVTIPYSVLKSVIDPTGPLSRIVGVLSNTRVGASLPDRHVNGMDTRIEAIPITATNGVGTGAGVGEGNGFGRGSGNGIVGGALDYDGVFLTNQVTQKARITSKPEPTYTEEARKNNVTGTVVLRLVLAASGQATNIRVVAGLPNGLTERAIAAARQIKFTPARKDGRTVSQFGQLEYNFNLD